MRKITLLLVALPVLMSAQSRSFTDKDGRAIVARPISKDSDSVKVRMDNGRDYEIPLDRLSDADAGFVRNWQPPKFKVRVLRDRVVGVQSGGMGSERLKGYRFQILGDPQGKYLVFQSDEMKRAIEALKRFSVVAERFKDDELPNGFRAEMPLSSLDPKTGGGYYVASFKGKPVLRGGCIDSMQDGISVEIAPYLVDYLTLFKPEAEIEKLNQLKQKAL